MAGRESETASGCVFRNDIRKVPDRPTAEDRTLLVGRALCHFVVA